MADVLFIASMDKAHYADTIRALELGYDILLEKPISSKERECVQIVENTLKYNRVVAVCHVLRYTPFYQKIKALVDSGAIGEVVTLSQTENVGFWHYAHSFVRGNWGVKAKSSPMILQKCCHDTDIIRWLVDSNCLRVSSFGSLSHFNNKNAPKNAQDACVNCLADCIYNAKEFYSSHPEWLKMTGISPNKIDKGLATSRFGRCVYKCDNDVVDHQVVNMEFKNGVTAQLTMTAFSKDCNRTIRIHGTLGEIIGDLEKGRIVLSKFGRGGISAEPVVFSISDIPDIDLSGHQGGDILLVKDFFKSVSSRSTLSSVRDSLESHIISFAAERSRLCGGKPIVIN